MMTPAASLSAPAKMFECPPASFSKIPHLHDASPRRPITGSLTAPSISRPQSCNLRYSESIKLRDVVLAKDKVLPPWEALHPDELPALVPGDVALLMEIEGNLSDSQWRELVKRIPLENVGAIRGVFTVPVEADMPNVAAIVSIWQDGFILRDTVGNGKKICGPVANVH